MSKMAPAPGQGQDGEPKAPDKQYPHPQAQEQQGQGDSSQQEGGNTGAPNKEKSGQLESLDEGQLRILLDEAAAYRRPKDREGKSRLFKELLQKAEQDSEPEWGGAQCYRRARRSLGGGKRNNRPPLTHSGSLQDLAEGGRVTGGGSSSSGVGGVGRNGLGARSKHRQSRAARQVSARSQQGGSLPSNVDQQHNLSVVEGGRGSLEDVRCSVGGGVGSGGGGGDYIATVHCVNPPTEYYYGRHRADSPLHHYYTTEDLDIRSQPSSHVSVNFTSRATLEIGSPAPDTEASTNTSTSAINTTLCDENTNIADDATGNNNSATTQPDSANMSSPSGSSPLSGGIGTLSGSPLQLVSSYCSVKSVVGDDIPPVSVISQSGGLTATTTVTSSISHPITSASTPSSHNLFTTTPYSNTAPRVYQPASTDFKKSLDENGNAVQTVNATITTSGLTIKKTKKKKCKNETETLSNEIDGYRGNEKLNDILKFIESDAGDTGKSVGKPSNSNKGREGKSMDDSHEKGTKKRSTERRSKDGMNKLKKSNSMEELSRSKLDDLTTTSAKDSLSLRKSKKQSTFDQSDASDTKRNDRRSWGNDGSDSYYHENNDDTLSINTSNSSSSQSSVSGSVKGKKTKTSPRAAEAEPQVLAVEAALETADFQTVTNKKKIRKRHSPVDEGRGKANNGCHNHNNHNKNGRFPGSFNMHDRDTAKRNLEKKNIAIPVSPPSDSNDDMESLHSLCGEAAAEKVQASYADMARAASQRLPTAAAPAATIPVASPPSPPPPPNLVTSAPQRLHNFPDLIESCNYYSNERNIHDKYLDVSTENTKNLMLKESSPVCESTKVKTVRSNIVDAGTQVEVTTNHSQHPLYSHEQYPALEPRQRMSTNGKNPLHKSNSVGVTNSGVSVVSKTSGGVVKAGAGSDKRPVAKSNSLKDTCLTNHDHETNADYYVAYVEHTTSSNSSDSGCAAGNSSVLVTAPGADNSRIIISSNLSSSETLICKPPDVVLPIPEMSSTVDMCGRPPVIILNEELKKSSDAMRDIDGITFGFDINEQLLNGDGSGAVSGAAPGSDSADNSNTSVHSNRHKEEVSTMLIYNSAEFPPIKEHQLHHKARRGASLCEPDEGVGVLHVGRSKSLALRYLPPPDSTNNTKDTLNLERLVHYVGMAWEDTIKSPGGKVRYFSE